MSDRLSFWRTKQRKLRQCSVHGVLELSSGNLEKFRTDLGREAHQDSKHEAVPLQRLKHKQTPKFSGVAVDFIGTVR